MASLWIVDGYNFIRSSRRFSGWEAEDPSGGKRAALAWLGEFSQITGEEVCVILDAYSGLQKNTLDKSAFGIQILESRGGYTADEEIMALAKERGQRGIVVSSDREILAAARQAGCSVLSSQEFEREVGKILRAHDEEEEDFSPRGPPKGKAFRPPREKKKAFQILKKYQ